MDEDDEEDCHVHARDHGAEPEVEAEAEVSRTALGSPQGSPSCVSEVGSVGSASSSGVSSIPRRSPKNCKYFSVEVSFYNVD